MNWQELIATNWPVIVVGLLLVIAAYIDGRQLRVPNWLTFPMVAAGLIFSTAVGGWFGLGQGLLGMVVGLVCLLPLYAVGGMGAGDVKLMAGVGAWLGWKHTLAAFCVSAVVGGVLAIVMAAYSGRFRQHYANLLLIVTEWMQIKDPKQLTELADERKPSMLLLPYGIPICIGSLGYFLYAMYVDIPLTPF